MTWYEIKSHIEKGDISIFNRTPDVAEKYHKHKENVTRKGSNLMEFMVKYKLHWDLNELQKLSEKYPTDKDKIDAILSDKSLYTLIVNNFPYNFDHNVYHLCLWSKIYIPLYIDVEKDDSRDYYSKDPACQLKIQKFWQMNLAELISECGGSKNVDYCWFINYPNLQSIRQISHIHILIYIDKHNVPHADELITKLLLKDGGDTSVVVA
ncbi:uncharacterized protein SCODWIG_03660 [Saccharomycodes ludwigii]|uniref:N-acetylglucosamine-induced protein 1 n=2 Tax=Saccharomycodes ludwigii TaxID=36035 RepID=A0A376BBD7_9ASCO|nr:uncharacterized protein SCODWIG_03660 [Saccharomycodes ludwigii]